MTVLAATAWPTNAHMIEAVVELGYIKHDDEVVDLTYGRGKWWTRYQHDHDHFLGLLWKGDYVEDAFEPNDPVMLIDDWFQAPQTLGGGFADVVCFDPPYVSTGGRSTSTITDFNSRYGLVETPRSPWSLHVYNVRGLAAAIRLCKGGGYILTKTMNYVSSGQLQPQSHWFYHEATQRGLRLCEEFHHVGHARAQPAGRAQQHARTNVSTLYVWEKPRAPRS